MTKQVLSAVPTTFMAMMLLSGCGQEPLAPYQATWEQPAESPSGKYRMVVVRGYNGHIRFAQFQITTNEPLPRVLFCSHDFFRTSNLLYFIWDTQDRVWVSSGDVGTFYWVRGKDQTWEKHVYGQDNVKVPEALRQRRASYFDYIDRQRTSKS